MHSPRNSRSVGAFTLIELLTVIAIIGILAAILIPTVAAVRKRALVSHCTSNMRQWGTALNLYANDNKQTLPNGTDQNSNLQWFSTTHRDTLMRYGLTWEMFFCRGNKSYSNAYMTDEQRTKEGGNGVPIGFVYLPGTTFTAFDRFGRPIPSKYKETRLPAIKYRLVMADLNRKWNGSFLDGTNHSDADSPIGGNHLYVDGAVKWVAAEKFLARPAMSGSGSDYYFATED